VRKPNLGVLSCPGFADTVRVLFSVNKIPAPPLNPSECTELPAHRSRWHFEARAALRFAAAAN